jgi:hypothetical protein
MAQKVISKKEDTTSKLVDALYSGPFCQDSFFN